MKICEMARNRKPVFMQKRSVDDNNELFFVIYSVDHYNSLSITRRRIRHFF